MTCNACPNPANCSPTFCHYADVESVSVTATSGNAPVFWISAVETPHDKTLRHFWDASPPGYYEAIDAYTGPSRLHRVLDWVGNQWDELNELGRVCVAVVGVAVCCAAAVAAVEAMT